MIRLQCATGNPGKLKEFRLAAGLAPVEIELLPSYREILPCVEDGHTFEENASIKALHYGRHACGLLFADDSGLEVEALGGAPGIHSARFAGPEATGAQNNELLLSKLTGAKQRRARFVTAISLARNGVVLQTTLGMAEGEILVTPRGSLGFGYDALFLFPPLGRTFAELGEVEKFAVSARGEAFRHLLDWLARTPT